MALAIYWPGLTSWFLQDDYAWLGLLREVREGGSLWDALFAPSQHGTWRPLGERAYFLLFPWLFGYEPWPMRAWAFITLCAAMALLSSLVLRLTGSRLAAVLAPVLWAVNSKLTIAMVSNGAYVHLLCGFLLLLALWGFQRYLDSGLRRDLALSWAAYAASFGAMETSAVFPALATAMCLAVAREKLRLALWFWPASILFFLLHMKLVPKMAGGSYGMHFDGSVAVSLGRYWLWCFEPVNLAAFTWFTEPVARWAAAAFSFLLAIFVLGRARRGDFIPLLFLAWFAILLGPVLPLKDHVTDYYLTVPLSALAALGATAFAASWSHRYPVRAGAVLMLVYYLAISIPSAHGAARWWHQRGQAAERLVRHVFAVRSANPGKILLLDGVTDEQFWSALAHYPFVERGKTYVYLTPGTERRIQPHPESGVKLEEFFLSPEQTMRLQNDGLLVRIAAP
jgi:hypothetical protein